MCQRQAATYLKIPRSTLDNKRKNKFPNTPGHPNIFAEAEVGAFATQVMRHSELRVLVDELDFRFTIKAYVM